ncbi:hypothetical protein HJC23_007849 [Cyclotella cryptica]|uniref:Uncharacterized protein n=1 Tax=Cyclotella cryptica TaxID=29204 RepID=A0ABD3R085_9STRA|eukprot:CCRYP_000176-RA/>CCRYP_000176-RA protein AED:0.00 eAED:0.00 QI:197/-1/1/1/-1/1/1/320/455
MQRTGSTSCLLRPKTSLSQTDLQRLAKDPPTATVLTVTKLPSYNADRLYITSELQDHSSLHILKEISSCQTCVSPFIILYLLWDVDSHPTPRTFADGLLSESVAQCLIQGGEVVEMDELQHARSNPRLSHYSPRRQHEVSCESTALDSSPFDEFEKPEQAIRIYVVVDKLASSSQNGIADRGEFPKLPDLSCPSYERDEVQGAYDEVDHNDQDNTKTTECNTNNTEQTISNLHNHEIKTAESLARAVASSRFLRNRIDGISIGITSDSRAAPGLEACMDAVARSCPERRGVANQIPNQTLLAKMNVEDSLRGLRSRPPYQSPISIVVCKPEDLDGRGEADSHHQHHSEHTPHPLLQCRVTAEWNGNGDYNTFSDRAMQEWRRVWSDSNEEGKYGLLKRRVPRLSRKIDDDEEVFDEPVSTLMVIAFIIGIVWYIWKSYSEHIYSLAFCTSSPRQI